MINTFEELMEQTGLSREELLKLVKGSNKADSVTTSEITPTPSGVSVSETTVGIEGDATNRDMDELMDQSFSLSDNSKENTPDEKGLEALTDVFSTEEVLNMVAPLFEHFKKKMA